MLYHSDCLLCLLPCSPVLHTEWGSRTSLCTLEVIKYLKLILVQGKKEEEGGCSWHWNCPRQWDDNAGRKNRQSLLFLLVLLVSRRHVLRASFPVYKPLCWCWLEITRGHPFLWGPVLLPHVPCQCSGSLSRPVTSGCQWKDSLTSFMHKFYDVCIFCPCWQTKLVLFFRHMTSM